MAGTAAAAAATLAAPYIVSSRVFAANPIETVHWSCLAASDGEV